LARYAHFGTMTTAECRPVTGYCFIENRTPGAQPTPSLVSQDSSECVGYECTCVWFVGFLVDCSLFARADRRTKPTALYYICCVCYALCALNSTKRQNVLCTMQCSDGVIYRPVYPTRRHCLRSCAVFGVVFTICH